MILSVINYQFYLIFVTRHFVTSQHNSHDRNDCIFFSQLLQAYKGNDTASTRMMVLSDGEETKQPWVLEALPTIEQLGITVDTIAYRYMGGICYILLQRVNFYLPAGLAHHVH